MADTRLYTGTRPTRLTAAATSSQTTLTLSAIQDRYGNTLTMSDFGTLGYGVISPGKTQEEQFTFTGISSNQLTGVTRGIALKSPYTTAAANQKAHAAGEIVIIYTNSPALYDSFFNKANDETITGIPTFTETAMPRISASHSYGSGEEEYLATKRYVDGVALAGAPDASTTTKGVVEEATQAEVDARTAAGSEARLFIDPTTLRAAAHHDYAADAGASDSYAITVTPAITAYATGQRFIFKANTANTGAATLAVNGLSAISVVKNKDTALADNDIAAGQIVEVVYDGTNMQMVSPTDMDEAQTFFANTDMTGAEAETLSLSATSNADALHTHSRLVNGYSLTLVSNTSTSEIPAQTAVPAGFSDATTPLVTTPWGSASLYLTGRLKVAEEVGAFPYRSTVSADNLANTTGAVWIGTDLWLSGTGNAIQKNAAGGSFVSGDANGPLGHDPTNSYLLMLTSTTNVRRFSGIAGTALTQVDNITLANAVTATIGFAYDATGLQYIAINTTTDIIYKFSSSGTMVSSSAYTFDDTQTKGLAILGNRVYAVNIFGSSSNDSSQPVLNSALVEFIPTAMTI